MLRRVSLGVLGAGAAAVTYRYNTDEGFSRTLKLWSSLGPVVGHYRLVEFKQKMFPPVSEEDGAAEFESLNDRYCKPTVETLRTLQGMYTKYGQVGAGLTDLFSKGWIDELRTLEDKVPPQPLEVVLRTVREDMGGLDPAGVFSEFDEVPLGSASIGQVHRAVLRDTGEEVAVKVQYPDSVRLFKKDMATIRGFMEIMAPEQVMTLSELESMFEEEFDYQNEAANLKLVHTNMSLAGYVPATAEVPLPREHLCTKRVLVMDLLRGRKLIDGLREYVAVVASKQGKTVEQFEREMAAKIEREGLPSTYDGPSALAISLYRGGLKLYDVAANTSIFAYNVLWGHWTGQAKSYVDSKQPINTPQLVEKLMQIHAVQLFKNGVFNADPHAGNFLMLDDGRIGLIDFGATKRLTRGERLVACLLYAALRRGDKQMIKDLCLATGYKSRHNKMENIFSLVELGYDSFGMDVTGGKNIQQFTDDMYKDDPWEEAAGNLVMAQFLSIRLRAMMMQCGHPVRCSHYWGDFAERILEQEGMPYATWSRDVVAEVMKDDMRIVSSKGSLY